MDVGIVEVRERDPVGGYAKKQLEVDFVVNRGSRRYYIQSAFAMDSSEKVAQEQKSLRCIDDSFKKIIVVRENIKLKRDEDGFVTMGVQEFLLNPNSLDL